MGVCTKTGDKGQTSLYTGERVDKASLRVETYGVVDELGSALAMARAFCQDSTVREKVFALQKQASLLMADLASLGQEPLIGSQEVAAIEKEIEELESTLPPLKAFVIPGDTKGGAMLDLARTIARRAERRALELSSKESVHESDRLFLNRISDYCFILMRLEDKFSQ